MDGINQILRGLSLEEKISLLSGKNNFQSQDIPGKGIDCFTMADSPCGLRKQRDEGDHLGITDSVPATALVSGGCLAATWNPACAKENGLILGSEAAQEDVDVVLAPAFNIVRSPLCGRNFEYFSEDPFLTGKMAAAFTQGIQEAGVDACPKHFAANNQETEREYVNAIVDERTLREIYLPAFEETVRAARPLAVMTALNQINGHYGAEQHHLITDILRNEWGFDGITISDWYGVVHRDLAVKAGLDLEMPCTQGVGEAQLLQAVQEGRLTEQDIDSACIRLLYAVQRVKEKRSARNQHRLSNDSLHQKNHEKAWRIAQEGIVLLKNERSVLPLSRSDRIAVIGPYAKLPKFTLEGSARVVCTKMDIPLKHMQRLSQRSIVWAEGFRADADKAASERLAAEALAAAKAADKVVFYMGQGDGVEKEGLDRRDLSMPQNQVDLLHRIAEVQNNLVVVLSNASPVEMPWRDEAAAILECFMAGQGFGSAIADILYGEVNPSGKLPVSFTKKLEDTSAYLNFPGDGRTVYYNEGVFVGYRYYDKKDIDVLYPFGHGLSYTEFAYTGGAVSADRMEPEQDTISVTISVKNTGDRKGAEVVQLYIGGFDTQVRRPVRELKGFQKVFLQPQEEKQITFILSRRDFAYYDEMCQEWLTPEGSYRMEIGASSRDIRWKSNVWIMPKTPRQPRITAWSPFGKLKRTEKGKQYYAEAVRTLKSCMKEDTVFLRLADLNNEAVLDRLAMRFLNLLTNGLIDNDQLLQWIDTVNQEA